MNNIKKGMTRFILLLPFGMFAAASFFNAYYYKIGLFEAANIFTDAVANKIFRTEGIGSELEAQLLAEGYGQIREVSSGHLLVLTRAATDGMTHSGSPKFNLYFKSKWDGARLRAYRSGGKWNLYGFCDNGNYNCLYTWANPPKPAGEHSQTEPSLAGDSGFDNQDGLQNENSAGSNVGSTEKPMDSPIAGQSKVQKSNPGKQVPGKKD